MRYENLVNSFFPPLLLLRSVICYLVIFVMYQYRYLCILLSTIIILFSLNVNSHCAGLLIYKGFSFMAAILLCNNI